MSIHDTLAAFDDLEPKIREEYVRAPFAWPGGKFRSLNQILPHIRYSKIFVDGCGGSGVITLNRKPSYLEVFNDRHSGIVAFYRCIRDHDKMVRLKERLDLTLHAREEFIWCHDTWENCQDDVERAARWYYIIRMSFGALGRNFARATNSFPQAPKAFRYSLDLFEMIHYRFKNIQIENQDILRCIKDFDSRDTTYYVDPDYLNTTPGVYKHTVDHARLLNLIKECKGEFVVSGYANQLYDMQTWWDERYTWDTFISIQSNAYSDTNHLGDKQNMMDRSLRAGEVLWLRRSR